MSLNSLKIATDGYLKRTTKAVLVIAVAGYLNFGGTPPTPPPTPSGGGGGGAGTFSYTHSHETKILEERKKRIQQNEKEWMLFIKIFTEQCQ